MGATDDLGHTGYFQANATRDAFGREIQTASFKSSFKAAKNDLVKDDPASNQRLVDAAKKLDASCKETHKDVWEFDGHATQRETFNHVCKPLSGELSDILGDEKLDWYD